MINIDRDGGLPFREAVQFLPETTVVRFTVIIAEYI